ncbi:MAG TPA: RNA polymerase sigma factor [Tepidisphaeraceae bacterium]|nr:RNA polymerase sigma factor [Tepidisphaeraceae bacterium]
MIDDTELLNQIGRGDPDACRTLLERHGHYLFGVAHALVGNAADAEDLVQETLVGVLGSRFRGESSVRTWLVRILTNQAGMLRRKPWRRAGHAGLDETPSPAGPATSAGGADARLDLATMLAALSLEHRQVLVLRELEGLSYEEIAEALHLPRGTVESRLFRAREDLRKKFKGYL